MYGIPFGRPRAATAVASATHRIVHTGAHKGSGDKPQSSLPAANVWRIHAPSLRREVERKSQASHRCRGSREPASHRQRLRRGPRTVAPVKREEPERIWVSESCESELGESGFCESEYCENKLCESGRASAKLEYNVNLAQLVNPEPICRRIGQPRQALARVMHPLAPSMASYEYVCT
jgi:hypothetical protein